MDEGKLPKNPLKPSLPMFTCFFSGALGLPLEFTFGPGTSSWPRETVDMIVYSKKWKLEIIHPSISSV